MIYFLYFITTLSSVSSHNDCTILSIFGAIHTNAVKTLNWDTSYPNWCCNRTNAVGITCNANKRVDNILLDGVGVTGKLDNFKFSELTELNSIYLSKNSFYGMIDKNTFANLTNLYHLELEINHFNGSIEFLRYTGPNLNYTDISFNDFTGNIDVIDGSLSTESLNVFKSDCNLNLYGNLTVFSKFINLNRFAIAVSTISGDLWPLSKLYNLQYLFILSCNISGDLKPLSNLTGLTYLSLPNNSLSGTLLPLKNHVYLQNLYLNLNNFIGNISSLNTLVNLQNLNLGANNLDGDISSLCNMNQLVTIEIGFNLFSGSICPISNSTNLNLIVADNNKFYGSTDCLISLTNLVHLSLNNNKFSGSIEFTSKLYNLSFLNLGYNNFGGSLSPLDYLSNLNSLYLNNNNFDGDFVYNPQTNLAFVNFSYNYFTGLFPYISISTLDSYVLDITSNNFLCPFPVYPNHVLLITSPCDQPIKEIIYDTLIIISICISIVIIWLILKSKFELIAKNASKITVSVRWIWNCTSIVFFCLYIQSMFDYIYADYNINCNAIDNQNVFSPFVDTLLPGSVSTLTLGDSFSEMILFMNEYNFPDQIIELLIGRFSNLCESVADCKFNSLSNSCEFVGDNQKISHANNLYIELLIIYIFIKSLFELSKIVLVIVSVSNNKLYSPTTQSDLYASSLLSPLLYFCSDSRVLKMLSDVSSWGSFVQQLIARIFLDFPQLVLFLYYSLFILKTGLPFYGIISMAMSGILFAILLLRAIWYHILFKLIYSNSTVITSYNNELEAPLKYNLIER